MTYALAHQIYTKCDYCARVQGWPEDGQCRGCGAGLPIPAVLMRHGQSHVATTWPELTTDNPFRHYGMVSS